MPKRNWRKLAEGLATYLFVDEKDNATHDYEGDPEGHIFYDICTVLGLDYTEETDE